ncbi:MAG: preprotein translocase subunit SecG [Phycisphaeraceae bacterium]|nr:preprotein translocase subunit SecG [Phycisphaeraceae bacterium]
MPSLPIVPTLALAPWITAMLVVAFLFVCLLLILIILIQKPQGGGLSGAFGSGAASGSGQTVFGARTGDALTIGTITVFVLYLGVAIGLNYAIRPSTRAPAQPVMQQPADSAPATTPANVPAAPTSEPQP